MNIPTDLEMRKALSDRVGEKLQSKFYDAAVAICGLGGLGSNIAISLARAGVGKLILVDYDKVDITNLNRQQYKVHQIGMYKTDALNENIREICPYTNIAAYTERLGNRNYKSILSCADVICEAFDVAEEKSKLTDYVLENMPDKFLVAASGMAGIGCGNEIKTRKLTRRFYLCGDGVSSVENGNPLYAPRVMICAGHQAQTVLKILAEEFDV